MPATTSSSKHLSKLKTKNLKFVSTASRSNPLSSAPKDATPTCATPPPTAPRGDHYAYSPNQVDFFAFFVIPEDIWYIVPIAELRRTRFAAYLNPYDPKNKYFRYLEAWHLLQK